MTLRVSNRPLGQHKEGINGLDISNRPLGQHREGRTGLDVSGGFTESPFGWEESWESEEEAIEA